MFIFVLTAKHHWKVLTILIISLTKTLSNYAQNIFKVHFDHNVHRCSLILNLLYKTKNEHYEDLVVKILTKAATLSSRRIWPPSYAMVAFCKPAVNRRIYGGDHLGVKLHPGVLFLFVQASIPVAALRAFRVSAQSCKISFSYPWLCRPGDRSANIGFSPKRCT